MPPAGFEPAIPGIELPQTHVLNQIGCISSKFTKYKYDMTRYVLVVTELFG
jgi:hypothetical protein